MKQLRGQLLSHVPEPVLQVDEDRLNVEKSRFMELVEKEYGGKEAQVSKRRNTSEKIPRKVPEVHDPEDLIGKRLKHQEGETQYLTLTCETHMLTHPVTLY